MFMYFCLFIYNFDFPNIDNFIITWPCTYVSHMYLLIFVELRRLKTMVDYCLSMVYCYFFLYKELSLRWVLWRFYALKLIIFHLVYKYTFLIIIYFFQDYPLDEVLSGPYLLSEWKPELVNKVLGYLKPDNIRYLFPFSSYYQCYFI